MSNNIKCPCGSLYIPTGSKYNSNGLSLRLYYNDTYLDLKLVHNQDSYLSSGETFVSTTENITLNEPIIIKNIVLYHGNTYNLQINDIIKIVCKSFNSKNILGLINIGSLDNITNFDSSVIDNKRAIDIDGSCLNNTPINLYNDKIQLEIYSICDFFTPVCCDNIPNLMSLTNQINNLSIPCCSTTTTTTSTTPPPSGACCERGFTWNRETQSYIPYTNCLGILTEQQCNPYTSNDSQRVWLSGQFCDSCEDLDFCSQFLLPSSFNVNVIGYGDFDGQEAYVTFTKNGNTYSSSGVWPCGAYFELSMSCDEINKEFYYDGLISCCNQSTKWIHDPTPTPLIFPNARPPLIISYIDCNNCLDCVTTTTSTTPPPLPCEDKSFGALTINGYAFYRRSNRTVNIPGIGPTQIKCAGGHVCNRTNFVPRLILDSITLDAQPINVNNGNDGGDRDDTFIFNIPDITLLKDGASIQLACTTNNCHQGVTAIVLTAEIDGVTRILFNSCLVPGNIVPIDITCEPPVCNIEDINWSFTYNGTLNGNPWVVSNSGLSIRYNVEDSLICGGSNSNTQFGTAIATIITGSGNPVTLDINFDGVAELEQSGSESLNISLNNNIIASATSAGGNLGCSMGPIIKTIIPLQQNLTPNQTHELRIEFTTVDELFHVGAYYDINLIFCEGAYSP